MNNSVVLLKHPVASKGIEQHSLAKWAMIKEFLSFIFVICFNEVHVTG